MNEIAERSLDRGDGRNVDAVDGYGAADGSTVSGADEAPIRSPARPNAFENVRPTTTFGKLASSGMNDTPANSAYASSTKTTALLGTRRAIVRIASSGIVTPVGLFGFVRNTTRVSRPDHRQDFVERECEVRLRHHLHELAAGNRRVEPEDLERRLGHDGFEHRPGD